MTADAVDSVQTDEPLVSAVVIFLNEEQFLREAVESVIAQTYQHWELLLVDDGSTDASTAIAQQYASAHPDHVRYVEHRGHVNRGMSASRNAGVARARGEWIALLDSDDVWEPEKLAAQIAYTRAFPRAELVFGPARVWFSWNAEATEPDYNVKMGFDEATLVEPPGLAEPWLKQNTPMPSAVLVRRETYERLGGFEESFRGAYEDQAFYLKIALNARVLATPTVGLRYRRHDDSCIAQTIGTNAYIESTDRFEEWAVDYMRANGVQDNGISAALKRGLAIARGFSRMYAKRKAAADADTLVSPDAQP